MITAVIAEKPSVAKDIANVLNVRERHDGYLSGNGYLVTWAFGHLVQLAMPEAYGYAGFRRENLPILPQEFKYIPRQIREGKEYKPDPGVLKQLKVIREVFDRSDRIVVATDAGREGEAIHRYIYNYLGCRKALPAPLDLLADRPCHPGGAGQPQARKRLRQPLPCRRSPCYRRLGDWAERHPSSQHRRRAGHLLPRTGTDAHLDDDLLPLSGEQGFHPADLFTG